MIYLGDILPPETHDELRKGFQLVPWPVVRRTLPDLEPEKPVVEYKQRPPVDSQQVLDDGIDYRALMQERPGGKLGSEV